MQSCTEKKPASVNSAVGTAEPASMKLLAKKFGRLRPGWRLQQQNGVDHAAGIRQRRFGKRFHGKTRGLTSKNQRRCG